MSATREKLVALARDFDIYAENVQRERDPSGDVAGAWRAAADAARGIVAEMDEALATGSAAGVGEDRNHMKKLKGAIFHLEEAVEAWKRGDRPYEHVQARRDCVVIAAEDMRDAALAAARGEERAQVMDALEQAWGVIANASGGNWLKESEQWQEGAALFRKMYFALLPTSTPEGPDATAEER